MSVLSPTVDTYTLTSVEDVAKFLNVVSGSFVIFFSNKFCNSSGQCLHKHHKYLCSKSKCSKLVSNVLKDIYIVLILP